MTKHKYPWPSIPNVSALIDRHVDYGLASFSCAQTLVAASWRHHRCQDVRHKARLAEVVREFRGRRLAGHLLSSRDFHAFFTSMPVVASQKFDGTNVGITEDGLILGRRTVIPSDTVKYCGVATDAVKASLDKVAAVKAGLLMPAKDAVQAGAQRLHCTVYGELMCNGQRFDYAARNLGGAYTCFGVILRGTQKVRASCVGGKEREWARKRQRKRHEHVAVRVLWLGRRRLCEARGTAAVGCRVRGSRRRGRRGRTRTAP
jgi:hypothetical protein